MQGEANGKVERGRQPCCHCEAPKGPWRPEREARGSALGVQSREGSYGFADCFPTMLPGTARLPRRFAPRNGNSDSLAPPNHHCNTRNCRRRSLSAATDAIGWYVLIGSLQTASAFPRLPRPRWGLAMTRQGGAAMHQRPDAVELPCTRRSVSAATDAIGAHHFNDSLYELHCLPEIATSAYGLLAMTNLMALRQ